MEKKISLLIDEAIREQIFPGCVVGYFSGGEKTVLPFGNLTYGEDSFPVSEDTIYDVASLTKSIPTSSLALFLLDRQKIKLNDLVITFIPELEISYHDEVTIWHLLTHTLDFDLRLSQEKHLTANELWQKILQSSLKNQPGSLYSYTNATSIILGQVIERVTGKALDVLADEIFFKPLQMMQTTFHPSLFNREMIAPSEIDSWRGREIRGEVHDESAFILSEKLFAGSAGLFSTVPNILSFLEMLLLGGVVNGKHYFSQRILKEMTTNQIEHLSEYTGLGWELNQKWYMGKYATENTFGKTGFTGCTIVADINKGKAVVLLSNSTYPIRPRTKDKIHEVRRELSEIVFRGD